MQVSGYNKSNVSVFLYRLHYDICASLVDGNDLSPREREKDTNPEYI